MGYYNCSSMTEVIFLGFSLSAQAVPKPTTMTGDALAGSGLALLKRRRQRSTKAEYRAIASRGSGNTIIQG